LIRHGQYFDNARSLDEMKLTSLGREQLQYTGQRLNQMNIAFNRLIHSGMVRALESATILVEQLQMKMPLIEDKNLTEGLPVAPIPYVGISQRYVDVRTGGSCGAHVRRHLFLGDR
jgi:phosphohistidine phosphatase SixA